MGIEKTSLVDPAHANAFVTGLTFSGTGNASTMTAMTRQGFGSWLRVNAGQSP
jgi:hypothetical protein